MNDRQLLELAAKAAGISFEWLEFDLEPKDDIEWQGTWNPLTDDGDALRLAVKLRLQVTPGTYDPYEAVAYKAGDAEASERVTMGYGMEEATRRAIVRAAAQIGKEMA